MENVLSSKRLLALGIGMIVVPVLVAIIYVPVLGLTLSFFGGIVLIVTWFYIKYPDSFGDL